MADKKDDKKEVQPDKFSWKKDEVEFIPPEQYKEDAKK